MDDNAKVRLAEQPRWALEYRLSCAGESNGVLYLAEGRQIGYLPLKAAIAIGWHDECDDE